MAQILSRLGLNSLAEDSLLNAASGAGDVTSLLEQMHQPAIEAMLAAVGAGGKDAEEEEVTVNRMMAEREKQARDTRPDRGGCRCSDEMPWCLASSLILGKLP